MDFSRLIQDFRFLTKSHVDSDSVGHDDFFSSMAHALHSFLDSNLEGYLFSFPFISEEGTLRNPTKDYFISEKLPILKADKIKEHLKAGELMLSTDRALSITKIMIDNLIEDEIQSILIHKGYQDLIEYSNELFLLNLTEIYRTDTGDFSQHFIEVAHKFKVSEPSFEKLFNRIETFVNLPNEEHYVFLIKPYTHHKEFNVVFILGCEKIISITDFFMFRFLLYRYLSEIAIKKIRAQSQLLEVTKTIYGLGHLIKNRAVPAQLKLIGLSEYLDLIDSGEYEKYIQSNIENAKLNIQHIKNIGHLLDIISRSIKTNENTEPEQNGQVFGAKADWHKVSTPFGLSKELRLDQYKNLKLNGIGVEFVDKTTGEVKIRPTIILSDGTLARPANFVYEELLLEVALNAAAHGLNDGRSIQVHLHCTGQDETWYYFENEATEATALKHGGKVAYEEWFDIDQISTGGIYYYNNMLKISKSGILKAMFTQRDGKFYFRIGFRLLGLNYS